MSASRFKSASGLWRQTRGSGLIELAFVTGILLLIVTAIIDFGHAWFLRQVITNASREGARYAVVYRVNNTDPNNIVPLAPSGFVPTVETKVKEYLANFMDLASWVNLDVEVGGDGYTVAEGTGLPVTVTIETDKEWFAVHGFLNLFGSGWGNSIRLTATTTMLRE